MEGRNSLASPLFGFLIFFDFFLIFFFLLEGEGCFEDTFFKSWPLGSVLFKGGRNVLCVI